MKHDDPHTLDLFARRQRLAPARPIARLANPGPAAPAGHRLDAICPHPHHPSAPDCVLLASALLAHVESRGHSCLPLADLVAAPQRLLAWDSSTPPPTSPPNGGNCPRYLEAWLQALQHLPPGAGRGARCR